jgi:hypothetical protein
MHDPAAKLERAARAAALAAQVLVAATAAVQAPGNLVDGGDMLVRALELLGDAAGELYALLTDRPGPVA